MPRHSITAKGTGLTEAAALRDLLADAARTPCTSDTPPPSTMRRGDADYYRAIRAKRGQK